MEICAGACLSKSWIAKLVYKATPNNSDNKSLELGLCWSLARRVVELNSSDWVKMGQKHAHRLGESIPKDWVKMGQKHAHRLGESIPNDWVKMGQKHAHRLGESIPNDWVKMGQKHAHRLGESTPSDRVKIIDGSKACTQIRSLFPMTGLRWVKRKLPFK